MQNPAAVPGPSISAHASADADVIVLGAGAAGLAAARRLAEASLRVIVIEARHRIGGRVLSQPGSRTLVPEELGAEFIHGPAPETLALLREAGSAAIDEAGESWYRENGALHRDRDDDFWADVTLFEQAHALPADETVDRFLRRFDGDPTKRTAVSTARRFVEGFDAADPAIASAQAIAQEWESGVDSTGARPLGGYPPLFARLREACEAAGAQLRLSTIARRITWRRGDVAIDVRSGSGSETLHARAAVITLPAGVLRHTGDDTAVVFEPDVPSAKRDALRYIEMGHAVKVVLRFRTDFWMRLHDGRYRGAGFFRGSDEPFGVYWLQYPVRAESVVAWVGGPRALALTGMPSGELIARARDGFGTMLGEIELARAEFESAAVHDWAVDPFARGAYSYVAAGGGAARTTLGEAVDETLFFAGEATAYDGQGGTVNGALNTGERAAREALAALIVRRA